MLESGTAGLRGEQARSERVLQDEELAALLEREGVAAFVARWEQSDVLAGLRKLPAEVQASLRAGHRT